MLTDFLQYNLNDLNLLFSKVLSNHWQTLQREILLHEISGEDEDEYRIDEAGNAGREELISLGHSYEEDEGENHIDHHLLHRIVDRILLLTYKVGEKHGCSISSETSPGTGNVTIDRYEDNVDGNQYRTADAREVSSPDGLVDELVPETEVEVNSHHDFGSHYDRHYLQAIPVVATDDVAQYIQITYHNQEGEQGEDDEIFHRRSVSLSVVLILCLAEYEWLVSIAESLGYHRHDHRNLAGCSIDSELCMSIALLIDVREEDLIGSLIQNTGNTEHEDRPTVFHHLSDKHFALAPGTFLSHESFLQFLVETEGDGCGANQVDVESITHIVTIHDNVVNQVECNVQSDEEQLEGSKLQRALLVSEVSERDALESINSHGNEHGPYISWMVGIAHRIAQRRDEEEY